MCCILLLFNRHLNSLQCGTSLHWVFPRFLSVTTPPPLFQRMLCPPQIPRPRGLNPNPPPFPVPSSCRMFTELLQLQVIIADASHQRLTDLLAGECTTHAHTLARAPDTNPVKGWSFAVYRQVMMMMMMMMMMMKMMMMRATCVV